jgi:hypothetical protein
MAEQVTDERFYRHIEEFNPPESIKLIKDFIESIDRKTMFTEYGYGPVQPSLNIRLNINPKRVYFGLMSTDKGFKAWCYCDDTSDKYMWFKGSVEVVINDIKTKLL